MRLPKCAVSLNETYLFYRSIECVFLPNYILQSLRRRGIIFDMNAVSFLAKLLPEQTAYAHCDLPCGVYDPAQARIEAESVLKIMEKYKDLHEDEQKWRAIFIKEQR